MRVRKTLNAIVACAAVAAVLTAGAQPASADTVSTATASSTTEETYGSDPPVTDNPDADSAEPNVSASSVSTHGLDCANNGSDDSPTRDEVLDRAQSWLDVTVRYSQTRCYVNKYGDYRTDCSGFVSMVWGIGGIGNGHFTGNMLDKAAVIARSSLKPGDALLRYSGPGGHNHVALFVKWADSAHTRPVVFHQTGDPHNRTVRSTWPQSYAAEYTPIRYDHIQEETVVTLPYDSFTGDAKADLVVHNGTDVAIRKGTGNGFTDLGVVSSGWGLFHGLQVTGGMGRLYFADWNADHKTDMIVHNGTEVSVRLNNGSGGFGGGTVVSSGWGRFHGLDVTNGMGRLYFADFNGDGRADMIVHNGTDVAVRLNTTSGWSDLGVVTSGWGRFHGLQVTDGMGRLYFADIDGDGRDDMIVHNGTDVAVRHNDNGDGFTDAGVVTTGWGRFHGLDVTDGMGRLYLS
jgi:hypothetical protein